MAAKTKKAKLVVIGSGPGGYSAAFRAADLMGEGVILIEKYPELGGVCLNMGCIPSKALLHVASIINESKVMDKHGITFSEPKIDLDKLRQFKDDIIGKSNVGLKQMAKMRKVECLEGEAKFTGPNSLTVKGKDNTTIEFEKAIIAAGSEPVHLPFMPDDERIWDSTAALELRNIPKKMLIVGGGIIGLEMATVYHALGTEIDIVEFTDFVMPGVDKDIATPFFNFVKKRYNNVWFKTKVVDAKASKKGIEVFFEGENAPEKQMYDAVLQSVGRIPNGKKLDAEQAGIHVTERGFIETNNQMQTNVPHIYAIGDIVGQPMLAHKAIPEGRLAGEVIAGKRHVFDAKCIPNVAYTDPEVAWVGLTEIQAKEQGIQYEKGVFPWMASGRANAIARSEGVTKLIFDKASHKVLGGAIVGVHAGDLISEVALAIEMGCEAEDLSLTIHPHPTLSETIMQACEVYEGTVTDLPNKKK